VICIDWVQSMATTEAYASSHRESVRVQGSGVKARAAVGTSRPRARVKDLVENLIFWCFPGRSGRTVKVKVLKLL